MCLLMEVCRSVSSFFRRSSSFLACSRLRGWSGDSGIGDGGGGGGGGGGVGTVG